MYFRLIVITSCVLISTFVYANIVSQKQKRDGVERYVNGESFHVDLKATGIDWLKYSTQEKIKLMIAIFEYHKLNPETYSIGRAVEAMDTHYYSARKMAQDYPDLNQLEIGLFFKVPCVLTFEKILTDIDIQIPDTYSDSNER